MKQTDRESSTSLAARAARARRKGRIAKPRHDPADRTKADAILLESGERYRQLIDVAPDAIFVHSDGRVVLGASSS